MSIIIRDIDLPKDDKSLNLEIYSDGHIWINWGPEYEHKDNVAIQIDRPHGRLIDGDKLKALFRGDAELDTYTAFHFQYAIDEAPTILEAEE